MTPREPDLEMLLNRFCLDDDDDDLDDEDEFGEDDDNSNDDDDDDDDDDEEPETWQVSSQPRFGSGFKAQLAQLWFSFGALTSGIELPRLAGIYQLN